MTKNKKINFEGYELIIINFRSKLQFLGEFLNNKGELSLDFRECFKFFLVVNQEVKVLVNQITL